jgi:hypothetical protein
VIGRRRAEDFGEAASVERGVGPSAEAHATRQNLSSLTLSPLWRGVNLRRPTNSTQGDVPIRKAFAASLFALAAATAHADPAVMFGIN